MKFEYVRTGVPKRGEFYVSATGEIKNAECDFGLRSMYAIMQPVNEPSLPAVYAYIAFTDSGYTVVAPDFPSLIDELKMHRFPPERIKHILECNRNSAQNKTHKQDSFLFKNAVNEIVTKTLEWK